ncbi:MAG: molecular chaperone DnaJ [SAR86 cluster bacterium]|uniref:Molecular chaperone DnaJ n=1 Tax=SAR86 cluster bacterium TaxID=2030880 RepID=A0A2A4MID7_9GAMM|nr:MAG: molecular chaperone DnaJ [SAR86 cluster bacterium]
MLLRLLFLIILPIIAYMALRSMTQRFSLSKQQFNIAFVLTIAVMGLLIMIAMGRIPVSFIFAPIGVGLTFMLRSLPTLLRLLPLWQMLKSKSAMASGRSSGQCSTIRTDYLLVELQHDSGVMDGSVLKGEFQGMQLSQLNLEQLLSLLQDCQKDADSFQVLEAYLDRSQSDWRESIDKGSANTSAIADDTMMTRNLALEILGLNEADNEQVSTEKVVKAHRSLMQKMHPDRGGSDYLAKKINAAKDYLVDKH